MMKTLELDFEEQMNLSKVLILCHELSLFLTMRIKFSKIALNAQPVHSFKLDSPNFGHQEIESYIASLM